MNSRPSCSDRRADAVSRRDLSSADGVTTFVTLTIE